MAAIQKVACYRFLYILTESEQNYFHQNLGEKWPATMENKQLFVTPKLDPISHFLYMYNTAESKIIWK